MITNAEALILAKSNRTYDHTLHALRTHKDPAVRAAIASNRNIHPTSLSILAKDTDLAVLKAVANNTGTYLMYRNLALKNIRAIEEAAATA
jgi:hypothetical protein